MALTPRFEALARAFVAACVGSGAQVREALRAAAKARVPAKDVDEVLLLVVAYAGVPRAILAFTEWRHLAKAPSAANKVGGRLEAGEATFRAVYGARADRIRAELRGLHPELHDAVIEDAYGRILSREGLSARERELLAVATLVALDAPRQAAAHAIGARSAGAASEEILAAAALAEPHRDRDSIGAAQRALRDALRLPANPGPG
jgi:4-carboxymuconolactone decarboxylase